MFQSLLSSGKSCKPCTSVLISTEFVYLGGVGGGMQ